MEYMFYYCSELISLDLSNFIISNNIAMNNMFLNCNNNVLFCLNDNISSKLLSQITNLNPNFYNNSNCSNICFCKYKKIILDAKECVLSCSNYFKFEYKDICYSKCPNGTYNIHDNICINGNYINNNDYISTSIHDDDYFKNMNIHDNMIIKENYINITNYMSTSIYIDDYFKNMNKSNNNITNRDIILVNIRNELKNHCLDTIIDNIIEKGKTDLIIKDKNIVYQLTTLYNQNNIEYKNITTINFGECETKLRDYYNISNNISLLFLKIEIFEDGFLIPIIEYEIYNSKTKEKLDLNICKFIKINLNIPVKIDENNII